MQNDGPLIIVLCFLSLCRTEGLIGVWFPSSWMFYGYGGCLRLRSSKCLEGKASRVRVTFVSFGEPCPSLLHKVKLLPNGVWILWWLPLLYINRILRYTPGKESFCFACFLHLMFAFGWWYDSVYFKPFPLASTWVKYESGDQLLH